jgi:hypothetical protein
VANTWRRARIWCSVSPCQTGTILSGPPLALGLLLAQHAEAGGVPQDLLVQRPQLARADERLVVEARWRERRADDLGGAHHVELEPGLGVQVLDPHALADRLGAGPHAGRPVDRHNAVRALTGAAQQPAPAVVLETARERAQAGGVQGRSDRVALVRLGRLAVER